jgi:UDP-glucose 4-epimerase
VPGSPVNRGVPRRILVTGASRSTGWHLVRALAEDPAVERIVAVDERPPVAPFAAEPPDPQVAAKAERLAVDLRSPAVVRELRGGGIDTVVHLGVGAEPLAAGGRGAMKEHNVLGTLQLLAAAYHARELRRLVLKSTTAVYGAAPDDPAVWTESMAPRDTPRGGFARDAIEVEDYVRSFERRRPDVAVTVLRLANQVGPTVDNPLTRYFELPACPTVFGFDPRLQFLHESDTLAALGRVILGPPAAGTFNLAGDGVVLLSQAIRIAGKPPLPIPEPLVSFAAELLRRVIDFSPEQARFLQYGRVADTTLAREVLGLEPKWSSLAAFHDFAEQRLSRLVTEERVDRAEQQLLAGLRRLAAWLRERQGAAG